MQRNMKRWLLSPFTQLRAYRFAGAQGAGMSVETAWILIRVRKVPAEAEYALLQGGLSCSRNPGVHFDEWSQLPEAEKRRRKAWLARKGKSPFRLLGVSHQFVLRAGIEVTDWGLPPDGIAGSD